MRALIEKLIGAVAMAEVVELPWLGDSATIPNRLLSCYRISPHANPNYFDLLHSAGVSLRPAWRGKLKNENGEVPGRNRDAPETFLDRDRRDDHTNLLKCSSDSRPEIFRSLLTK